ncbi:MAG: hypothetical protein AAF916_13235, partial [Planctomycetota bacterium]
MIEVDGAHARSFKDSGIDRKPRPIKIETHEKAHGRVRGLRRIQVWNRPDGLGLSGVLQGRGGLLGGFDQSIEGGFVV